MGACVACLEVGGMEVDEDLAYQEDAAEEACPVWGPA